VQRDVLDRLGMVDTEWHCPESKLDRLAALYVPMPGSGAGLGGAQVGTAIRWDPLGDTIKKPQAATMGGEGLCGTTADYLRFTGMLAGRGELDGVRILAPGTVDFMASNHLPGGADLAEFGRPLFAETTFDGVGFGLGVSVVVDPVKAKVPYSAGEFGWGGAASTTFWIDPVLDMTAIFMTQLLPSDTLPIRSYLRQLIKAAIVEP